MKSHYIIKPEYFFKPINLLKKLRRLILRENQPNTQIVKTSIGFNIKIDTSDAVGKAIYNFGIYELGVSELICRLIDKNSICIDGGANVGFMSLLMAKRAHLGKVYSFEASHQTGKILIDNSYRLNDFKNIDIRLKALSNEKTKLRFKIDNYNSGESRVTNSNDYDIEVDGVLLDEEIPLSDKICLFKLDVEEHELQVLEGAEKLLSKHKITHIIYEDHQGYPSNVSDLLEKHNYKILKLNKGFWKPLIGSPETIQHISYEPSNYIATIDEEFVREKLKPIGWQCYSDKN